MALTPLFPLMLFGLHFVETFYMFFLIVVAFFTKACGKIWPLNWPLWEKALRGLGGFFDREAALSSEKATYGVWSTISAIVSWIGALLNLFYLIFAAIITTILYLVFAVVVGFIFGPLFTMIMGLFTYLLGPRIAGDSWASGFAGHFMNIIGYEDSDYPKWLYIRKFKFALLVLSTVLTVFSKPVLLYIGHGHIFGIIVMLILLSVIPGSPIGPLIGLTTGAKAGADASSKPAAPAEKKAPAK